MTHFVGSHSHDQRLQDAADLRSGVLKVPPPGSFFFFWFCRGHYVDGFWGASKVRNGVCFPLTHHLGGFDRGRIMRPVMGETA